MHVATREYIRQQFTKEEYDLLKPLVCWFFERETAELTDAYLAHICGVSRSNMYRKRTMMLSKLREGVDYSYALSADSKKPLLSFSYDAFVRWVSQSDHPSTSEKNRKRIHLVIRLDSLFTKILRRHNDHQAKLLETTRATMLRMKQTEVQLKDDLARRDAQLQRALTDLEEALKKARRPPLKTGHLLRGLLETLGYRLDENRTKDIRDWFRLLSRRLQGVASYDVPRLRGEARDYFFVDVDKVDELCADISRDHSRLPLKLSCIKNKTG